MPHRREGMFEAGEEVALGAALENFRDKGGARAVAEAVRLGDKGLVELAVEPFGGGGLAPPRAFDAHGKGSAIPGAAARHQIRSSRSMLRDSASFFIVAVVPLRAPVSIC